MQSAVSDLKEEIQEQSKISTSTTPALLPTASEMATIMEKIEQLLQYVSFNSTVYWWAQNFVILASEGYFRFPECISLVEEHLKIPFFGLEKNIRI